MSGWESLYQTAAGDYNNGNYKDSYFNYLKTTTALLHKLGHEVTFSNRDTVKAKPHNAAQLFNQLKFCVQRLEDILQNRATNGGFSSLQPSSISDMTASMITPNPTPQYIPLIPFSPLTRKSMHHVTELATVNQRVAIAKQKKSSDYSNNNNLSNLRKLDEQVRQQKAKLDQVNNQIQSIAEVTLIYWDANEVSKQLTIIDSELYKKVDLTLKDKRTSKAQACIDFHRYLTNSFTHQFMIYADTARSSMNSSRSAQHPRENIIAHAVRIAYFLLNVHRNFNSFAAIMKALTSPEVRRIRRLWANLPPRTSQIFKELSVFIKKEDKEDNDYKAYKEMLAQKMESFRDVGQGMVVIPWIQPHYEEIKAITQSYNTSGRSGDNTEVILSAPGQRKLASIFSLLEQCQSNVISFDEEEYNFNGIRKVPPSNSRARDTILVDGTPINLSLDLSCLGFGNLELHHWLVSRVYLTKQQLIDESMVIEPLGDNEQVLRAENENEEEEEESDRNSVGRYDIGSEDSGDNNIEAGSSSNHEMTNGTRSQSNKPSPNNKLDEYSLSDHQKSSLMIKHERSESKPIVNGTTSTSVSREISETAMFIKQTEEPNFNVDIIENDSVGTNSLIKTSNVESSIAETTTISSFTSSSKTKPISIPQPIGQKPHQHSLSPGSTLLNPNAQPFVPRSSLSSSAPGLMGNNINVSIKELTEMGEKNKIRSNITSNTTKDDDDVIEFVYPKGEEEEEEKFVYQTPTEATSSNDLKNNTEDDDDDDEEVPFTYPNDSQEDNDDGEGSSFVYPTDENASSNKINTINEINIPSENDVINVKVSSEGLTKV